VITKHLDNITKLQEVLLYYNFVSGVIDEEEHVLLVVEPNLFTIGAIILPKPKILVVLAIDAKFDTDAKSILIPKLVQMPKLITIPKSVSTNQFFIFHTHQEFFW
jgi:hypothetical protein